MSVVTNLIISLPISCHIDTNEAFLKLRFYDQDGVFFDPLPIPNDWCGGTKNLECQLFIGAYNLLNLDELISFMRTLPWDENDKEIIQLIVKEDQDTQFRIINVFP